MFSLQVCMWGWVMQCIQHAQDCSKQTGTAHHVQLPAPNMIALLRDVHTLGAALALGFAAGFFFSPAALGLVVFLAAGFFFSPAALGLVAAFFFFSPSAFGLVVFLVAGFCRRGQAVGLNGMCQAALGAVAQMHMSRPAATRGFCAVPACMGNTQLLWKSYSYSNPAATPDN